MDAPPTLHASFNGSDYIEAMAIARPPTPAARSSS
jgi:hypothetical protein